MEIILDKINLKKWINDILIKIKYDFTASREQKLYDRISRLYDLAKEKLLNEFEFNSSKDLKLNNEILIEQYSMSAPYFSMLLKSETANTDSKSIRDRSIEILYVFINGIYEEKLTPADSNNGSAYLTDAYSLLFCEREENNIKNDLFYYLTIIENYKRIEHKIDRNKKKFIDYVKKGYFDKIVTILKEKKILLNDHSWNKNSLKKRVSRDIVILILKLKELHLIEFQNESKLADICSVFFETKVYTSVLNSILNDGMNKNDKEVFDELSFLDIIKE